MMKAILHAIFFYALTCMCMLPAHAQNGLRAPGDPVLRDGDGVLGQIFNLKKCGLNYVQANARILQRNPPIPSVQPVSLVIAGIPAGAVIEQAYLWAEGSGDGLGQTATVVNPAGITLNLPLNLVGSGPDKCWGYAGSYTYRGDITAHITGNGTYVVSGIPTSATVGASNDMDGVILMIIYSEPCALYEGHMIIHDGMVMSIASDSIILTGVNACGNSVAAQAFLYVGDMQSTTVYTMNGVVDVPIPDMWNYISVNTNITTGQATATYGFNNSGDCLGFCVAGLYYQTTTCASCTAAAPVIDYSPTQTIGCTTTAIALPVQLTGGSGGYNYAWSNGDADSVGNYTITASPTLATVHITNTCGFDTTLTITVTYDTARPLINYNPVQSVDCAGDSITLPVQLSGGTGGYTYLWNNGDADSAGNYTITVSPTLATVHITNACGFDTTLTLTITYQAIDPLQVQAPGLDLCLPAPPNAVLAFTTQGGAGGNTYNWAGPAGAAINIDSLSGYATVAPLVSGLYTVTVTDHCGNMAAGVAAVAINPCGIIIPNIVTPNGDGINDEIHILNLELYPGSAFSLYNRWGQQVYQSADYKNNYRPTDLTDGVYYYVLKLILKNGPVEYNGSIQVATH